MDYYWTLFKNGTNGSNTSNGVRGHNGNCTSSSNRACESSWELVIGNDSINGGAGGGNSRLEIEYCNYPLHNSLNYTPIDCGAAAGAFHAPVMQERENSAGRHIRHPDPHLTCLKLGKRHYFEDVASPPMAELHVATGSSSNMTKKGKTYRRAAGGPPAPPLAVANLAPEVVPRCQVGGCESVLENAKDYHRRHKVCEMHAKAPKVVVLGTEQRFCQQCSRFHAVAEFDESKRSCRRRLAGHNERRRKSSQEHHSLARKHSQDIKIMATAGRHPHFTNSSECALSLLSSSSSSSHNPIWNISSPSDDLPARCSAALRELIAENRASVLACRQLINSNQMENCNNSTYKLGSTPAGPGPSVSGGHVTLDLMQDPDSAFGLLSVHDHEASKEGNEEDCSELWKVPLDY